jgi:F-type H+-transporting ATPase subunit epsilon
MYDKPFDLDIITPERVVYRDKVVSFSAPGVEGSFQVLYNHAPLMSIIEVGKTKLQTAAGQEMFYATGGGFVEVKDNKVSVLVESAERADEIDVSRAEAARERAERRLTSRDSNVDVARAQGALLRAINRLRVAGKA